MRNEIKNKEFFTASLLKWYNPNARLLPWKGIKHPYLIWLSEIILQQTRVEQGLPYYNAFKNKYPTVKHLAKAKEDEVMKLWQGLGYYSRARNMHATAKYIVKDLNGKFPDNYKEILKLKGIGPYTAAAIASFAFNEPHAVVDGNVFRVLSRFFGIKNPIDSIEGKEKFNKLANQLINKSTPGKYNQAIMDFGATCCTPSNPSCIQCPLQKKCFACKNGSVDMLPVRSKKLVKKERFFNFLVIQSGNKICIEKRNGKDIWKNLYQFPLIETPKEIKQKELRSRNEWNSAFKKNKPIIQPNYMTYKQLLTHQKIHVKFWEIRINNYFCESKNQLFINVKRLGKYAFPKIIDGYLKEKLYL